MLRTAYQCTAFQILAAPFSRIEANDNGIRLQPFATRLCLADDSGHCPCRPGREQNSSWRRRLEEKVALRFLSPIARAKMKGVLPCSRQYLIRTVPGWR